MERDGAGPRAPALLSACPHARAHAHSGAACHGRRLGRGSKPADGPAERSASGEGLTRRRPALQSVGWQSLTWLSD